MDNFIANYPAFHEKWMAVTQPHDTARHAWSVYGLVRSLQPDSVLEIGPYRGGITALIALALNHNGKGELTTIDNFTHFGSLAGAAALQANLESLGVWSDRIHIIEGNSHTVEGWPAKIDLAVLDGDRTQPNFKREVQRVMDAGARCFCVHDSQYHDYTYWYMEQFRKKMFSPGNGQAPWDVIDFIYNAGFAVAMKRIDGPMTGWRPTENNPLYHMELP
jgi:cephalosporin hydroxylase